MPSDNSGPLKDVSSPCNKIFSPREALIRRRIKMKRYKKAWQARHPEAARALFRKMHHNHRDQRHRDLKNYRRRKLASNPNWDHERYLRYRIHHLARALCKRTAGEKNYEKIKRWIREQLGQLIVQCRYCSAWLLPCSAEIDHVMPLSRGGTHDIANLAVSCRPCNRSKSNKLLHEWQR